MEAPVETLRAAPAKLSERIVSMDALRGFAILGILIMNIQSFSMIESAYMNPTAYGDLTGLNLVVWVLSHLFADQKFMSLFSLMFGAGIVLLADRLEARGIKPAKTHYRRSIWLIIIGMIHAYFIWYGDILFTYGVCALLAYLFRKLKPRWLVLIGVFLIIIPSLLFALFGLSMPSWPDEAVANMGQSWSPDPEKMADELATMRGAYVGQVGHRIQVAIGMQTFLFLIWFGWRAGGLMLLGMALYKWGILSAEKSCRFYYLLTLLGLGIGLPITIYGAIRQFAANWALEFSMFFGWQFNYWGSLFVALGYIGIIMLICKSAFSERFTRIAAPVGRMAFTNYLLQSIICTLIFYGHGLGMYGKVERVHQVLVVLGVWAFEILLSNFWLRRFRFGPAEWLWRSLTYFRFQPMSRGPER